MHIAHIGLQPTQMKEFVGSHDFAQTYRGLPFLVSAMPSLHNVSDDTTDTGDRMTESKLRRVVTASHSNVTDFGLNFD